MAMGDGGLSVADAMALQNNRGGLFGGGDDGLLGILFIIALLGGGNGFGFGGGNNQITNDFLFSNLNSTVQNGFAQTTNKLDSIGAGICSSTYENTVNLLNGFNGVNAAIAQQGYNMQNCCCETNRNIDAVRYENAQNTCAITTAIHEEGCATRALITANQMQELRDQLASERFANQQLAFGATIQASQANIINTLRPVPMPAYITCSPYASPCGVGC